ncbi:MAG: Mov34/MPN/PAD-1 family protein [Methanosarcinales archaeon]|nr:Mov34/MPN/PAD-1 family protein [ANME-2 cluster archaeon]MDF1531181.1 Mov34/MPN/PAD-1 family protein [ANME-2 cluster archaeon]MDW7774853.1 Mov34/MPN/PAD-1 family protein [Methanosarcinales archaeon]
MCATVKIKGIAKSTLDFILEVSKSSAPREFAGLLRAEDGVIKDVIFLPGTESSQISATIRLFMMPNISIAGSVHSHPTSNTNPSRADLALFARVGGHNIIAGAPYDSRSWRCYDSNGRSIPLNVLDIEFDDDDADLVLF